MPSFDNIRSQFPGAKNLSDEAILRRMQEVTQLPLAQVASDFGYDVGKTSLTRERISGAVDSYQSNLTGLVGAAQGALGMDRSAMDRRRDDNKTLSDLAAEKARALGGIDDWRNIKGPVSGLNFIGGAAAQSLPYALEFAGGALLGGATLPATVARASAGLGLSVSSAAARAAARTAGGALASYPSAVGDIMSNQREENGTENLGMAAAGGVPYVAANALFGVEARMARTGLARNTVNLLDNVPGKAGFAARTAASAGITAGKEGLSEALQEGVNQSFGRMAVNPNQTLFNDEANKRYVDSFVGGAALGGAFGAVGGGRRSQAFADQPTVEDTAPPLQLGMDPRVGNYQNATYNQDAYTVFPDGTAALNSEAAIQRANAPQRADAPQQVEAEQAPEQLQEQATEQTQGQIAPTQAAPEVAPEDAARLQRVRELKARADEVATGIAATKNRAAEFGLDPKKSVAVDLFGQLEAANQAGVIPDGAFAEAVGQLKASQFGSVRKFIQGTAAMAEATKQSGVDSKQAALDALQPKAPNAPTAAPAAQASGQPKANPAPAGAASAVASAVGAGGGAVRASARPARVVLGELNTPADRATRALKAVGIPADRAVTVTKQGRPSTDNALAVWTNLHGNPKALRRAQMAMGTDADWNEVGPPMSFADIAAAEGATRQAVTKQLLSFGINEAAVDSAVATNGGFGARPGVGVEESADDAGGKTVAPRDSDNLSADATDYTGDAGYRVESTASKAMGEGLVEGASETTAQRALRKQGDALARTATAEINRTEQRAREEAENVAKAEQQYAAVLGSPMAESAKVDWNDGKQDSSPTYEQLPPVTRQSWVWAHAEHVQENGNDWNELQSFIQKFEKDLDESDYQNVSGVSDFGGSVPRVYEPASTVAPARSAGRRNESGAVQPRAGGQVQGDSTGSGGAVQPTVSVKKKRTLEKSEAPGSRGSSDAKQLTAELQKFMRVGSLGRAATVVQSVGDLPAGVDVDGSTQGFVQGGRAYLIADNIAPGSGRAVFMHEVGSHLGLQGALSKGEFTALVSTVRGWADGKGGAQERTIAEKALARVAASSAPTAQQDSELVAYTIEEAVLAGFNPQAAGNEGPIKAWLRSAVAAVKNLLAKLGANPDKVTVQDVVDMAYGAAQAKINDGKRDAATVGPVSRSPEKTPLYEALRQVSRNGAAFRLQGSASKDLAGIARDMQAGTGKGPGFTADTGSALHQGNRKPTISLRTTNASGDSVKLLDIFEAGSDRPFVVIGNSELGQNVDGALAYQIAFAWAHNNGKRMRPDPAGLTVINRFRRSEAMISSALRFGTTAHLEPHPDQYVALTEKAQASKNEPEDTSFSANPDRYNELQRLKEKLWTNKSDAGSIASNVQNLIEASAQLAAIREPNLKKLTFVDGALGVRDVVGDVPLADVQADTADGEVNILGVVLRPAVSGVGASSAKRYALVASVARAVQQGQNDTGRGNTQDVRDIRADQASAVQAVRQVVGDTSGATPGDLEGVFYSKSAPATQAHTRTSRAWRDITQTASEGFGWALKRAAFTQDVVALAVKNGLPSASNYLSAMTRVTAEKMKSERAVADVLDAYGKLSPLERGTGGNTVNALLQESTERKLWAYQPAWSPAVQVDPALAKKYNDLTQEARAVIDGVFKHGRDSRAELLTAVKADVNAQFAGDIAAAKTPQQKAALEKDLRAALAKQSEGVTGNWPYAPLGRFGNYVVLGMSAQYVAAHKAGDTATMQRLQSSEAHYRVERVDTQRASRHLRDELASSFPGGYVDNFERGPNNAMVYGGRDALGALRRLRNLVNDTAASEDGVSESARVALDKTMRDLHLTLLAETSARKSELGRKTIAGANADMMRSFSGQGRAMAHYIAALKTSGDVQDALDAMKNEAGDTRTGRTERQAYYNELLTRHAQSLEYAPSPFVDKAMATTSLWMLISNPMHQLVNLLQPAMMTQPLLAGKHGYARSGAAMLKAYGDLGPMLKAGGLNEKNYSALPGDVQTAVRKLADKGVINISLAQDLGEFRSTEKGAGQVFGTVMQKLRDVSEKVESVNRLSSAISAYRLEKERGATDEAATNYAAKVIYETHGDYSGFNAPRSMRKGIFRLATQFRKFQLIQISMYSRLIKDAMQGASPEEQLVARKALAYNLTHLLSMGGLVALPGFSAVSWIMTKVFGDGDEPDDAEAKLRRAVGDKGLSDLLLRGAPKFAGFDLSDRVGAGGMLSLLPYADASLDRKGYQAAVVAALGPFFGGLLPRAADGLGLMKTSFENGQALDFYKGAEMLMPTGVANLMKAGRYEVSGVTQRNGDVVLPPEELSFLETFSQSIGLPGNSVTDRNLLNQSKRTADEFYKARSTNIKRDYNAAYEDNDAATMNEMRGAWFDMQDARSRLGYERQPLSVLLRAPMEATRRAADTVAGIEVNKRNRGFVEELTDD